MKHTPLIAVAAAAVLATAAGFAQDDEPQKRGQRPKLEVVEEDLASTRLALEELEADLAKLRNEHAQLVSWAQEQSRAAAALEKTLASSEAAGFTAGINPRSRELLLAGWRTALTAAQRGVPGAKSEGDGKKDERGR